MSVLAAAGDVTNFLPLVSGIAGLILLGLIYLIYRHNWQTPFGYKTSQLNPPPRSTLVHAVPNHDELKYYALEEKDSLDEHLDSLTEKLAEKEGKLQISKTKIRETQHEIENIHAIDPDVRFKYREVMDSLRKDLTSNETECRKLQDQIEWVSRQRAQLRDEVRQGHRIYGEAAAELAINLSELQRGRVTDKPAAHSVSSLRHRSGPCPFPRREPPESSSIVLKSNQGSPDVAMSRMLSPQI